MNTMLLKIYIKVQDLMNREEGQDLVEYALLVALVSLAAVSGITGLAKAISSVFNNISTSLGAAV